MNKEVTLTKDKKSGQEVKMFVSDEGTIKVSLPSGVLDLYDRDILYIQDRAFLVLNTYEGTRINVMYPLKNSEELLVRDFLSCWGQKRLDEVKNAKWLNFIEYWKHIFEFVGKNIDVKGLKPKYYTEVRDHRGFGDGINIQINILLSFGLSWQDDFDKCWGLTEKLVDEQIDRYFDGLDTQNWHRYISIQFRPIAGNKEGFTAFSYEDNFYLENWEKGCIVPMETFTKSIKSGMGTEGSGFYSDGKTKSSKKVSLDDIDFSYSHVVWYDK